jgi:hypothetical protein
MHHGHFREVDAAGFLQLLTIRASGLHANGSALARCGTPDMAPMPATAAVRNAAGTQ